MPSNSSELLSRLKTSLPRVDKGAEPSRTLHAFPATAPATPTDKVQRAPKLSVSLYPRDIQRLEEIKAYMKDSGFRNLSDSEALRLACRSMELNGRLVELYKDMQAEDGRRTQNKAGK